MQDFKIIDGKEYVPHDILGLYNMFPGTNPEMQLAVTVFNKMLTITMCNNIKYILYDHFKVFYELIDQSAMNEEKNIQYAAVLGDTKTLTTLINTVEICKSKISLCIKNCIYYQHYNCLVALQNAANWKQGLRYYFKHTPIKITMLEFDLLIEKGFPKFMLLFVDKQQADILANKNLLTEKHWEFAVDNNLFAVINSMLKFRFNSIDYNLSIYPYKVKNLEVLKILQQNIYPIAFFNEYKIKKDKIKTFSTENQQLLISLIQTCKQVIALLIK